MAPPPVLQRPGETPESRRRWRIFLVAELVLLIAWLIYFAMFRRSRLFLPALPFVLLGPWFAFTLPICVLYLLGRAPVMSLRPYGAYQDAVAARPVLDGHAFYARYYDGSGIPQDIPVRLRRLCVNWNSLLRAVEPHDHLECIEDELDWAGFFPDMEAEFGVCFTRAEMLAWDGTFDWLVRRVNEKRAGT